MGSIENGITTLQAYRQLYRCGLRAVQYSVPNRFVLRDRLRRAFRESSISDFEPDRILNTIRFLENASKDRGIEHKLLKNLLHVWSEEPRQWYLRNKALQRKAKHRSHDTTRVHTQAYDKFYWTLERLNESMGLCIR